MYCVFSLLVVIAERWVRVIKIQAVLDLLPTGPSGWAAFKFVFWIMIFSPMVELEGGLAGYPSRFWDRTGNQL